jgi:hypothetical protein
MFLISLAAHLTSLIIDLFLLCAVGLIISFIAIVIGRSVAAVSGRDNWATKIYNKWTEHR